MKAMHSIDGLISAIQEHYKQKEFYDVNLNFLKRSLDCPGSISNYLFRFGTHKSLVSQVEYYSTFNAVKLKSIIFYYDKNDTDAIVHKRELGVFPSQELYSCLEDADFFIKTDVFAICFTIANEPGRFDPSIPEVYIFSTL